MKEERISASTHTHTHSIVVTGLKNCMDLVIRSNLCNLILFLINQSANGSLLLQHELKEEQEDECVWGKERDQTTYQSDASLLTTSNRKEVDLTLGGPIAGREKGPLMMSALAWDESCLREGAFQWADIRHVHALILQCSTTIYMLTVL